MNESDLVLAGEEDRKSGRYATRDAMGNKVMLEEPVLEIGYHVPYKNTPAAWGARFITDRGYLDLVWNRQSIVWRDEGARDELIELLDGGVIGLIRKTYKELWDDFEVRGDEAEEHVLVDNDRIKAIGNTNASFGYFYVSAWLKGGVKTGEVS